MGNDPHGPFHDKLGDLLVASLTVAAVAVAIAALVPLAPKLEAYQFVTFEGWGIRLTHAALVCGILALSTCVSCVFEIIKPFKIYDEAVASTFGMLTVVLVLLFIVYFGILVAI